MAQFFEFIGNHLYLSSMWVVTLGVIIMYHRRTSGSSVGPQQAVMLINRKDAIVVDVREKQRESTTLVSSSLKQLNEGLAEQARMLAGKVSFM